MFFAAFVTPTIDGSNADSGTPCGIGRLPSASSSARLPSPGTTVRLRGRPLVPARHQQARILLPEDAASQIGNRDPSQNGFELSNWPNDCYS
jgi:hypothetical protein